MDKLDSNGSSRRMVVTELGHIKELVKQLEEQLGGSHDLCRHLASQIFSLTERSIGIITSSDFNGSWKRSAAGLPAATPSSPGELAGVPFRTTKKRKVMEKRKNQVRVSSAGGGDPPVDDGHSWRKYGQKEILGAKHPRAYYRCTHRNSQGCAATKQVQRTDEDSAIFDVFYLGTHTCRVHKTVQQDKAAAATQPTDAHSHLQNLTVKTEGLAMAREPQGWKNATTPASFCLKPEHSPFSAPSALDNWGVSPATSDSNHDHDASFQPFDTAEWRAESELQEVVSSLVFASTPPVTGMGITDELPDIDISSFFA